EAVGAEVRVLDGALPRQRGPERFPGRHLPNAELRAAGFRADQRQQAAAVAAQPGVPERHVRGPQRAAQLARSDVPQLQRVLLLRPLPGEQGRRPVGADGRKGDRAFRAQHRRQQAAGRGLELAYLAALLALVLAENGHGAHVLVHDDGLGRELVGRPEVGGWIRDRAPGPTEGVVAGGEQAVAVGGEWGGDDSVEVWRGRRERLAVGGVTAPGGVVPAGRDEAPAVGAERGVV